MPDKTLRSLPALVLIAGLSGCAGFENWLRGNDPPPPREETILGAPEAQTYIGELRDLISGDPYLQAEIHADAESAALLTPNPTSQLRYALVLATPGHAGYDPEEAATRLRDVLAQTEMMTPTEVALASVFLRNVDEQLVLAAELRRLRSENATAQSAEARTQGRRIAVVEEENARLRQELADVEEKLEALTSIERSIRAQDEANSN